MIDTRDAKDLRSASSPPEMRWIIQLSCFLSSANILELMSYNKSYREELEHIHFEIASSTYRIEYAQLELEHIHIRRYWNGPKLFQEDRAQYKRIGQ